jgi:hypothetical protein
MRVTVQKSRLSSAVGGKKREKYTMNLNSAVHPKMIMAFIITVFTTNHEIQLLISLTV